MDRPDRTITIRSRAAAARAALPALALLLLGAGCTSGIDLLGDGDHDVVPPADADGEAETHAEADVAVEADVEAEVEIGADADDGDAVADDGDADADTCVGGWFDPTSGLCWQDPPPSTAMDLSEAEAYCDALSLGGYGPGSWHVPTIDELRSLIRGCPATEPGGACAVTDPWCLDDVCMNEWCDGCSSMWGCHWPDPVSGICSFCKSSSYWGDRFSEWNFGVRFNDASVYGGSREGEAHVRCVRPGP